MRNTGSSGNSIVTRAIDALSTRLPQGWRVTSSATEPRSAGSRADAVLTFRAPDGTKARLVVEAKPNITAVGAAALAPRLGAAARQNNASGCLLVTNYLSPIARQRLVAASISYLDLTGNARIALERPGLFIATSGSNQDPAPRRRGSRSLKGGAAARIVRALCDWRPPVGVRELARRAGANAGYATRILTLLEQEDIVSRDRRRGIVTVKWEDLLRRWARDYAVARTNRAVAFLDPRGTDAFLARLRAYTGRNALTGSRAVPRGASVAPARSVSCYVTSIEQAATALDLRTVESGSNVLLLEPFDSVIWERCRSEDGLTVVAISQCVVDLLTGTAREPSEAEALLSWMEKNENAWRT